MPVNDPGTYCYDERYQNNRCHSLEQRLELRSVGFRLERALVPPAVTETA
jgi:hypothetical protein